MLGRIIKHIRSRLYMTTECIYYFKRVKLSGNKMNRPSYGCVRFGQKDKTPKIRATQAWRTDLSVVCALYTQTTQRAAEYHVIPRTSGAVILWRPLLSRNVALFLELFTIQGCTICLICHKLRTTGGGF